MNRYATLPPEEFSARPPIFCNARVRLGTTNRSSIRLMAMAKARGLKWIEGLEFVIEQRRGTVN